MKTFLAMWIGAVAALGCARASTSTSTSTATSTSTSTATSTSTSTSRCPELARLDCEKACDGYQRWVNDVSKDPSFAGDPLDRPACLQTCKEGRVDGRAEDYACFMDYRDQVSWRACFDRCRASKR